MDIKWVGSPNYGLPRGTKGRNGRKPVGIVYHIMAGTMSGTKAWFQNPSSKASAHYGIGKNGEIHQYVKEENVAWHAGNVNKPSWPLLKKYGNVNPNLITIGIEHEGYPGDPFPDSMLQAMINLTRNIVERWDIPVDKDHLIGHYRIDSDNKSNCPGSSFPWNDLFEALNSTTSAPKTSTAPKWKQEGLAWLRENGLITSDKWTAEDTVDLGTLGTILSRFKT